MKRLWKSEQFFKLINKIRLHITATSLMATTPQAIQRRNNWIECLSYLEKQAKQYGKAKNKVDFLTMEKV